MSGTAGAEGPKGTRIAAHLRHPRMWLAVAFLLLVFLGGFAVLGLTGRPLVAPGWIVSGIETRANALLGGAARLSLGGVELVVDADFVPRLRLRNVELLSPRGVPLALLPELRANLHGRALLEGRIAPRSLTVTGARVSLRRLADGSLDLSLQGGANMALSPAEVLDAIDTAFAQPALAGIERVQVDRLNVTLDDARTGQVWNVTGGALRLDQTPDRIEMTIGFGLSAAEGAPPARADMVFSTQKGSRAAELTARLVEVNSRDLAAQTPVLAWLGALNAPISGSFRSRVAADGQVSEMGATLSIGAGALQPTPETRPVAFDGAEIDMRYDPASAEMRFTSITVDSRALRAEANGTAWLKGMETGYPSAIVGQARITRFEADPEGLFAAPVRLSEGLLDIKLELAPFRLRLGQLTLIDGAHRISARGAIEANAGGWDVALDSDIDAITTDRLLALWPLTLVPRTREWLAENVETGELFDVTAALRLRPGQEPRVSLGYEYRGAEVRFLRTLPPVQDGSGYATIMDNTYTLVVDRGHVTPPEGGPIDVSGSVLRVPDLRLKPTRVEIDLRTDSSVTAALSLLDQPPFGFLTKAGRPVDLASGRARLETRLALPLIKNVPLSDIEYTVAGELLDVTSDRVVPDRPLAAARLAVTADRSGLTLAGKGTLSGVPFDASWRQDFGPEAKGRSRVEGSVELSRRFNAAFGIGLPEGSVDGTGQGRIALDIRPGAPVGFRLESDLAGLRLSIPEVGWSKPAGTRGALSVEGRLGAPPTVDRLALSAPGLKAEGSVRLRKGGTLDAVTLSQVDLGWFSGAVTLDGRGPGKPVGVRVLSGRADLQRANLSSGGGGRGGGAPIEVALDRLTISEGIALTGFRGSFATGGGFNGTFSGRVNQGGAITGTVVPMQGRSAFRVRSTDAGAAIASAGIFERGRGGTLDMTLRPEGEPGSYAGEVDIRDIRVVDAPVLAELLGIISVVGLLEQLGGPGILFGTVTGKFRLKPGVVEIRKGAAVGASLGISAAGLYRTDAKTVDLQGTISPFYLLNGIGQVVSRRGEGLFGFNYRLRGPSSDPQVTVNPLSILTPGMFRDIFRAPPPKAGTGASP